MKEQYIQAVIALLSAGKDPEAVFSGLTLLLQKEGHIRLHSPILRGVHAAMLRKTAISKPSVVVARRNDLPNLKVQIKKVLELYGAPHDEHDLVIDPSIIGGFTASYKGKFADRSFKKQLMDLYRSIIIH